MTSAFFSSEISRYCYIKKYRNTGAQFPVLTVFEYLKIFTIFQFLQFFNMVAILMMSAKKTILGLFKLKVLWNEGYDVMVSVHDVANKILFLDSIYIVDVVM